MPSAEFVHVDDQLAETVALYNGSAPPAARGDWLLDAADLLAQSDPGPTPWLVEDLIVDSAVIAAVGRWKTTKSYGLLDLCISIATGEPAFGAHEIPAPGPVVFVNEESGRAALWRRLDSLCRGRAIDPERLRGRLMLGANARVKLDSTEWQDELVALGQQLEPRLFVFDPLARMKAATREENAQTEMAVLIEFMRALRQETGAAVCFVHHTGHQGEQMRGSSDLESVWETRLTWKRDGQSPNVTVTSEHREAEAADPITYQIRFDPEHRTMRFALVAEDGTPALADRILAELRIHEIDGLTTDEIRATVNVRRSDVQRTLEEMEVAGVVMRSPAERIDGGGRRRTIRVWKVEARTRLHVEKDADSPTFVRRPDPANPDPPGTAYRTPSQNPDGVGRSTSAEAEKPPSHAASEPFVNRPGGTDAPDAGHAPRDSPSHRPTSLEVGGTDGVPDGPPTDTDLAWLDELAPDPDDHDDDHLFT